jgi:hypothetical protein
LIRQVGFGEESSPSVSMADCRPTAGKRFGIGHSGIGRLAAKVGSSGHATAQRTRGGRSYGFPLVISDTGMAADCRCFNEIHPIMLDEVLADLLKNTVSVGVQDHAIMGLGLVGLAG